MDRRRRRHLQNGATPRLARYFWAGMCLAVVLLARGSKGQGNGSPGNLEFQVEGSFSSEVSASVTLDAVSVTDVDANLGVTATATPGTLPPIAAATTLIAATDISTLNGVTNLQSDVTNNLSDVTATPSDVTDSLSPSNPSMDTSARDSTNLVNSMRTSFDLSAGFDSVGQTRLTEESTQSITGSEGTVAQSTQHTSFSSQLTESDVVSESFSQTVLPSSQTTTFDVNTPEVQSSSDTREISIEQETFESSTPSLQTLVAETSGDFASTGSPGPIVSTSTISQQLARTSVLPAEMSSYVDSPWTASLDASEATEDIAPGESIVTTTVSSQPGESPSVSVQTASDGEYSVSSTLLTTVSQSSQDEILQLSSSRITNDTSEETSSLLLGAGDSVRMSESSLVTSEPLGEIISSHSAFADVSSTEDGVRHTTIFLESRLSSSASQSIFSDTSSAIFISPTPASVSRELSSVPDTSAVPPEAPQTVGSSNFEEMSGTSLFSSASNTFSAGGNTKLPTVSSQTVESASLAEVSSMPDIEDTSVQTLLTSVTSRMSGSREIMTSVPTTFAESSMSSDESAEYVSSKLSEFQGSFSTVATTSTSSPSDITSLYTSSSVADTKETVEDSESTPFVFISTTPPLAESSYLMDSFTLDITASSASESLSLAFKVSSSLSLVSSSEAAEVVLPSETASPSGFPPSDVHEETISGTMTMSEEVASGSLPVTDVSANSTLTPQSELLSSVTGVSPSLEDTSYIASSLTPSMSMSRSADETFSSDALLSVFSSEPFVNAITSEPFVSDFSFSTLSMLFASAVNASSDTDATRMTSATLTEPSASFSSHLSSGMAESDKPLFSSGVSVNVTGLSSDSQFSVSESMSEITLMPVISDSVSTMLDVTGVLQTTDVSVYLTTESLSTPVGNETDASSYALYSSSPPTSNLSTSFGFTETPFLPNQSTDFISPTTGVPNATDLTTSSELAYATASAPMESNMSSSDMSVLGSSLTSDFVSVPAQTDTTLSATDVPLMTDMTVSTVMMTSSVTDVSSATDADLSSGALTSEMVNISHSSFAYISVTDTFTSSAEYIESLSNMDTSIGADLSSTSSVYNVSEAPLFTSASSDLSMSFTEGVASEVSSFQTVTASALPDVSMSMNMNVSSVSSTISGVSMSSFTDSSLVTELSTVAVSDLRPTSVFDSNMSLLPNVSTSVVTVESMSASVSLVPEPNSTELLTEMTVSATSVTSSLTLTSVSTSVSMTVPTTPEYTDSSVNFTLSPSFSSVTVDEDVTLTPSFTSFTYPDFTSVEYSSYASMTNTTDLNFTTVVPQVTNTPDVPGENTSSELVNLTSAVGSVLLSASSTLQISETDFTSLFSSLLASPSESLSDIFSDLSVSTLLISQSSAWFDTSNFDTESVGQSSFELPSVGNGTLVLSAASEVLSMSLSDFNSTAPGTEIYSYSETLFMNMSTELTSPIRSSPIVPDLNITSEIFVTSSLQLESSEFVNMSSSTFVDQSLPTAETDQLTLTMTPTLSSSYVPEMSMPSSYVPEMSMPSSYVPEMSMPSSYVPELSMSESLEQSVNATSIEFSMSQSMEQGMNSSSFESASVESMLPVMTSLASSESSYIIVFPTETLTESENRTAVLPESMRSTYLLDTSASVSVTTDFTASPLMSSESSTLSTDANLTFESSFVTNVTVESSFIINVTFEPSFGVSSTADSLSSEQMTSHMFSFDFTTDFVTSNYSFESVQPSETGESILSTVSVASPQFSDMSQLTTFVSFTTVVPEFTPSESVFSTLVSPSEAPPTITVPSSSMTSAVSTSSEVLPTSMVPSPSLTPSTPEESLITNASLSTPQAPPPTVVPSQSNFSELFTATEIQPTITLSSLSTTLNVSTSEAPPTTVPSSPSFATEFSSTLESLPTTIFPSLPLTSEVSSVDTFPTLTSSMQLSTLEPSLPLQTTDPVPGISPSFTEVVSTNSSFAELTISEYTSVLLTPSLSDNFTSDVFSLPTELSSPFQTESPVVPEFSTFFSSTFETNVSVVVTTTAVPPFSTSEFVSSSTELVFTSAVPNVTTTVFSSYSVEVTSTPVLESSASIVENGTLSSAETALPPESSTFQTTVFESTALSSSYVEVSSTSVLETSVSMVESGTLTSLDTLLPFETSILETSALSSALVPSIEVSSEVASATVNTTAPAETVFPSETILPTATLNVSSEQSTGIITATLNVSTVQSTSVTVEESSSVLLPTTTSAEEVPSSSLILPTSTQEVTTSSVVPPASPEPTTTSMTTESTTPQPPTTPQVTTPTAAPNSTTPNPDLVVVTVIRLRTDDDIASPTFRTSMEKGLANAYALALERQQSGSGNLSGRRKRFAAFVSRLALREDGGLWTRRRRAVSDSGNVEVKITDVQTQTNNPSNAELQYTVSENGQTVPATQASQTFNTLEDQEVALQLQRVVVTIATPAAQTATPVQPAEDDKLWIIGAVLGPVALIVIVWVVVCVVVRHKQRNRDKVQHRADEPHLLTVKHGPDGEGTGVAEDQEYSQPEPGQSNGLLKSSPRKMTYEVNPDPEAEAKPATLKKGKKSPKKKKGTPVVNGGVEPESETLQKTAEEKPTTPKQKQPKKSSFRDTEEMEMNTLEPAQFYESQLMQASSTGRSQMMYSQPTFEGEEGEEEFIENLEEERKRNKQRQRMRRKQQAHKEAETPLDSTQAAYERAQKEIDRVLGPRDTNTVPDVVSGKSEKKRSKRRSKKGQVNEGYTDDDEPGSRKKGAPPPEAAQETLDEVRSRVHALLDDAFSLISNSYSSIGSGSDRSRSSRRNKVAPATPEKSERRHSADGDHKGEGERRASRSSPVQGMPAVEEIRGPKPGEKLHTPVYVDRTHGDYDPSGLITWSPYRAADESARIVLPQAEEPGPKAAVQEKVHTTTFMGTAATGAQNGHYTNQPGQPIVIRTRQPRQSTQHTGQSDHSGYHGDHRGQGDTHSHHGDDQGHTGKIVGNSAPSTVSVSRGYGVSADAGTSYIPYPGLETYDPVPVDTTTTAHFTATPTIPQEPALETLPPRTPLAANSEEGGAGDTVTENHRPPAKNVGTRDERDVIVESLKPGSSPKELVDSIREELKVMSGKMYTTSMDSTEGDAQLRTETKPRKKPRKSSYIDV